jgi:hypothetical protein
VDGHFVKGLFVEGRFVVVPHPPEAVFSGLKGNLLKWTACHPSAAVLSGLKEGNLLKWTAYPSPAAVFSVL